MVIVYIVLYNVTKTTLPLINNILLDGVGNVCLDTVTNGLCLAVFGGFGLGRPPMTYNN